MWGDVGGLCGGWFHFLLCSLCIQRGGTDDAIEMAMRCVPKIEKSCPCADHCHEEASADDTEIRDDAVTPDS